MTRSRTVAGALSAGLAIVVAAAACGTERSTPTRGATPVRASATTTPIPPTSASPATSPASAVPAATANAEGYVPFALDASHVRSVALHDAFIFHVMSVEGPVAVLDEERGPQPDAGRYLYLVDLEKGSLRTIYEAPEGTRAWRPFLSHGRVAWVDWRYEQPDDLGPLDWSVNLQDLATGETTIVASGVQRRTLAEYGAALVEIALTGDRLAYAVEDPGRPPDGWKIVVYSISKRAVERIIRIERSVYDLGIAENGDVAYTDGAVDPVWGYTYDGRLFVSRATGAKPVKLRDDAYRVAVKDGRIAWEQNAPREPLAPGATRPKTTGAAHLPRVWTASLADLVPVPAAPGPQLGSEQLQRSISTGGGFVTWSSVRDPAAPRSDGEPLCIWSPRTGLAYQLPTETALVNGIGDGWLVWSNHAVEPPTINGLPLAELKLP